MSSRRQFISGAAASAAAAALRPVFSRNCLLAAAPLQAASQFVHLNYNESPYGPSEKALAAIREAINSCGRYYADWEYQDLCARLADHHNLAPENILVGAGSTEILKLCDDLFLRASPRLVVAEPAYEAVIAYAVNSRATAVKVPLTRDFRHDLAKMAAAVTAETGMVYLCNPNNPTGTIVTKEEINRFLDRIPDNVPAVVDEAYSHFVRLPGYDSAIAYVRENRNVIVVRTFSKIYGLAGMRIGYAVAKKEIIEQLRPLGVPWAVSSLAAHAASAALADQAHVERVARLNQVQVQSLYDEMRRAKFDYTVSHANFVMINIRRPVLPVIEEFARRKILVGREFQPLTNHLRVTIGTQEEMQRFYAAFQEIMAV